MNLSESDAAYAADQFIDYFSNLGRIDEYLRNVKLDRMSKMPTYLPGCGPEEDMTTMTKSYNKLKHQVKSSKYYLFWGAATIAVMAGQIYVGTGYRNMSESIDKLVDAYVNRPRTMPVEKPLYQMPIIK